MWTTRYEIAAPDVVAEDFDDEIVAINLDTGRYFSLRGTGHAAWSHLASGGSLRALTGEPEALPEDARAAALAFLETLIGEGLLRERGEATDSAVSPAATPATSSPALAPGALLALAVESFDDMQEMLLADPIHEVEEETGWPVRRPEIAS
ncbi:MAG: PqqD family protein [Azospirillaceae bacterium]